MSKVSYRQGEKHHNHKLREEDVMEIRKAYRAGDITQAALANKYGVNQAEISNIINGQTWKHLPGTWD